MITSTTPYKVADIIRDTWPNLYRPPKDYKPPSQYPLYKSVKRIYDGKTTLEKNE